MIAMKDLLEGRIADYENKVEEKKAERARVVEKRQMAGDPKKWEDMKAWLDRQIYPATEWWVDETGSYVRPVGLGEVHGREDDKHGLDTYQKDQRIDDCYTVTWKYSRCEVCKKAIIREAILWNNYEGIAYKREFNL